MKQFIKNFCICGLGGWCLECFWTGLHSLCKKDRRILCKTSYWMFPIYGAAALLTPVFHQAKRLPLIIRGTLYTILIYTGEFCSGLLLKKHHACPWDYSRAKLNIKGLIRLDYAPVWFLTGLLFEQMLNRSTTD